MICKKLNHLKLMPSTKNLPSSKFKKKICNLREIAFYDLF